jgi:hypothetical protein
MITTSATNHKIEGKKKKKKKKKKNPDFACTQYLENYDLSRS